MTDHRQSGIRIGLRKELIHQLHQAFMRAAGIVLNIEIETVSHTEFGHRRERENESARLLKVRRHHQCPHRASLNGIHRRIGRRSVLPVLKLQEAESHVLTGTSKREAAHSEDRVHRVRFRLAEIIGDFLHFPVRTLHGGTVRQLTHHHHHALVFLRHEGCRDFHKPEYHQRENAAIDNQHHGIVADALTDSILDRMGQCFETAVEPTEETALAVMLFVTDRLQHRGAKRRSQRQSNHDRQSHRRHDRDGELTVNHAGRTAEESHRHKHGRQHHRNTDQSGLNFSHRLDGCRLRIRAVLTHDAFDVFYNHNSVVHQKTDGQHHGEHRQHIDGKPGGGKRTEQHNRNSNRRNESGPEVLQEQIHHEDHQHDGFKKRLHHFTESCTHERRSIERNHHFNPVREVGLQFFNTCHDCFLGSNGIGAGSETDGHTGRRITVVRTEGHVVILSHGHPGDVAQINLSTVFGCLYQDVAELLRSLQHARRRNRRRKFLLAVRRLLSNTAGRNLRILGGNGRIYIARIKFVLNQLVRIQPNTHSVFGTEYLRLADTFHSSERLLNMRDQIVAQVRSGHRVVAADKAHNHQEVGRRLLNGDAERLNNLRQRGNCSLNLVLYLNLSHVGVGTGLERDRNRDAPGRI